MSRGKAIQSNQKHDLESHDASTTELSEKARGKRKQTGEEEDAEELLESEDGRSNEEGERYESRLRRESSTEGARDARMWDGVNSKTSQALTRTSTSDSDSVSNLLLTSTGFPDSRLDKAKSHPAQVLVNDYAFPREGSAQERTGDEGRGHHVQESGESEEQGLGKGAEDDGLMEVDEHDFNGSGPEDSHQTIPTSTSSSGFLSYLTQPLRRALSMGSLNPPQDAPTSTESSLYPSIRDLPPPPTAPTLVQVDEDADEEENLGLESYARRARRTGRESRRAAASPYSKANKPGRKSTGNQVQQSQSSQGLGSRLLSFFSRVPSRPPVIEVEDESGMEDEEDIEDGSQRQAVGKDHTTQNNDMAPDERSSSVRSPRDTQFASLGRGRPPYAASSTAPAIEATPESSKRRRMEESEGFTELGRLSNNYAFSMTAPPASSAVSSTNPLLQPVQSPYKLPSVPSVFTAGRASTPRFCSDVFPSTPPAEPQSTGLTKSYTTSAISSNATLEPAAGTSVSYRRRSHRPMYLGPGYSTQSMSRRKRQMSNMFADISSKEDSAESGSTSKPPVDSRATNGVMAPPPSDGKRRRVGEANEMKVDPKPLVPPTLTVPGPSASPSPVPATSSPNPDGSPQVGVSSKPATSVPARLAPRFSMSSTPVRPSPLRQVSVQASPTPSPASTPSGSIAGSAPGTPSRNGIIPGPGKTDIQERPKASSRIADVMLDIIREENANRPIVAKEEVVNPYERADDPLARVPRTRARKSIVIPKEKLKRPEKKKLSTMEVLEKTVPAEYRTTAKKADSTVQQSGPSASASSSVISTTIPSAPPGPQPPRSIGGVSATPSPFKSFTANATTTESTGMAPRAPVPSQPSPFQPTSSATGPISSTPMPFAMASTSTTAPTTKAAVAEGPLSTAEAKANAVKMDVRELPSFSLGEISSGSRVVTPETDSVLKSYRNVVKDMGEGELPGFSLLG